MEEIYFGGCLWAYRSSKVCAGVISTEAGRANGRSQIKDNQSKPNEYDGYAECVQIEFDQASPQ